MLFDPVSEMSGTGRSQRGLSGGWGWGALLPLDAVWLVLVSLSPDVGCLAAHLSDALGVSSLFSQVQCGVWLDSQAVRGLRCAFQVPRVLMVPASPVYGGFMVCGVKRAFGRAWNRQPPALWLGGGFRSRCLG